MAGKWGVVVLSVAAVVVLLGSAFVADGLSLISSPTATPSVSSTDSHLRPAASCSFAPACVTVGSQGGLCNNAYVNAVVTLFGGACGWVSPAVVYAVNTANEGDAAYNIITTLYNYLNVTASSVDNLNATFQELLSYYEARAEAIVPEFLNYTWNSTLADVIAIDSGLAPSIEGFAQVVGQQQYEAWNATATGWNAAFGSGGVFDGDTALFDTATIPGGTLRQWAHNGYSFNVTQPFEWWAPQSYTGATGPTANTTYFNLEAGGTIVNANFNPTNKPTSPASWTVYDITRGTQFAVPTVTYTNWQNNTLPIESTVHSIGQFDLLKLVCNTNCDATNLTLNTVCGCQTGPTALVETSGAYAFNQNVTALPNGIIGSPGKTYINTGVPSLQVLAPFQPVSYAANGIIPSGAYGVCIAFGGGCVTPTAPMLGSVTPLGNGPGSVAAGANALVKFGTTANSLYNNSMLMAYDYWLTLRAITENGTYNIPSNCAIPTPSDAFPTATNYLNYALNANNVEAVYLAYLNAVALEYGHVFTSNVGFCGIPNLGFSFNWTGSWNLALNISASLYFANKSTPLFINGTPDPGAAYTNPTTWPVRNIAPALLYPTQYQLDVPVGKVFPVPINNPIAAVLVNYTGNLYYGAGNFTPKWGVPTYTSVYGNGNYSNISGQVSNTPSGRPVYQADALYVSSCVLNNVPQNPCDISVTYFNQFTIGHIHAIIPPSPVPTPGGGGASGFNGGICSSLFSWIPFIGTFVTEACNFILGFLEIALLILILGVSIYVLYKWSTKPKGGAGGSTTINVS